MKFTLILAQTGCLLPLLIFFNLFFGWMFFKASTWLVIELVLILLFMINAVFVTKRVFSAVSKAPSRAGAIDIEGKVLEDNNYLPSSSA